MCRTRERLRKRIIVQLRARRRTPINVRPGFREFISNCWHFCVAQCTRRVLYARDMAQYICVKPRARTAPRYIVIIGNYLWRVSLWRARARCTGRALVALWAHHIAPSTHTHTHSTVYHNIREIRVLFARLSHEICGCWTTKRDRRAEL